MSNRSINNENIDEISLSRSLSQLSTGSGIRSYAMSFESNGTINMFLCPTPPTLNSIIKFQLLPSILYVMNGFHFKDEAMLEEHIKFVKLELNRLQGQKDSIVKIFNEVGLSRDVIFMMSFSNRFQRKYLDFILFLEEFGLNMRYYSIIPLIIGYLCEYKHLRIILYRLKHIFPSKYNVSNVELENMYKSMTAQVGKYKYELENVKDIINEVLKVVEIDAGKVQDEIKKCILYLKNKYSIDISTKLDGVKLENELAALWRDDDLNSYEFN